MSIQTFQALAIDSGTVRQIGDNALSLGGPTISTGDGTSDAVYGNLYNYRVSNSSVDGTCKITLPVSWSNTMVNLLITGFNYASGESAWSLMFGGYNYAGSTSWIRLSASAQGIPFSQVRAGHDGTYCVILLGDTSSTWSYPHIALTRMLAGHNEEDFETGWSVDFITDESGLSDISEVEIRGDIAYGDNGYHLDDNEKLYLGSGDDAEIYYNGSHLIVDPDVVGSGKFRVDGNTYLNGELQVDDTLDLNDDLDLDCSATPASGATLGASITYEFGSGSSDNNSSYHYCLYTNAQTHSTYSGDLTAPFVGQKNVINHYGSGTLNNAWGVTVQINNRDVGDISEAKTFSIETASNHSTGSITTAYGLYISDQDEAGTNYAIYTNAGRVHFGDDVQLDDNDKILLGSGDDIELYFDGAYFNVVIPSPYSASISGDVQFINDNDRLIFGPTGEAEMAWDGDDFVIDPDTSGGGGIGGSGTGSGRLKVTGPVYVYDNNDDTSDSVVANWTELDWNGGATDTSHNYYASLQWCTINSGYSGDISGNVTGLFGGARHQGSGTVDVLTGLLVAATNPGSGVVSNARSLYVDTIRNNGTGSVTNAVGLYINDQDEAGTNYAIYTNAGRVSFGDDTIQIRNSKTPSSASDTGNTGEICWDSDYLYVCVATDTWKRVGLSSW